MDAQELRVLLADDDQDDYVITRDLLLGIESARFHLDWVPTYHAALQAIERNNHDLYLFDYHLGEGDGLDLLSKALAHGCTAPIILLTGLDDRETDTRAIKAGAADYLVKGQLDSKHLERSIRHAMERKRVKEEMGEYSTEIEIRRTHEQLKDAEILAHTDVLTGLGNRRKAEAAIQQAIAATRPFSLLVFDMNGFKTINDCYGHTQGDQLLKAVAQRMRNAVRDTDVVCRWGGDEFVVIIRDSSIADAEARARQIQTHAFGEFLLNRGSEGIRVRVGAGVGAAEYNTGETAAEFFERADQLLLKEKRYRHQSSPAGSVGRRPGSP
jgi:diguanylate cyclase (GGDEF)-like protein